MAVPSPKSCVHSARTAWKEARFYGTVEPGFVIPEGNVHGLVVPLIGSVLCCSMCISGFGLGSNRLHNSKPWFADSVWRCFFHMRNRRIPAMACWRAAWKPTSPTRPIHREIAAYSSCSTLAWIYYQPRLEFRQVRINASEGAGPFGLDGRRVDLFVFFWRNTPRGRFVLRPIFRTEQSHLALFAGEFARIPEFGPEFWRIQLLRRCP